MWGGSQLMNEIQLTSQAPSAHDMYKYKESCSFIKNSKKIGWKLETVLSLERRKRKKNRLLTVKNG